MSGACIPQYCVDNLIGLENTTPFNPSVSSKYGIELAIQHIICKNPRRNRKVIKSVKYYRL